MYILQIPIDRGSMHWFRLGLKENLPFQDMSIFGALKLLVLEIQRVLQYMKGSYFYCSSNIVLLLTLGVRGRLKKKHNVT
jgi:hypothetical protein